MAQETPEEIINQLQDARSENNVNWMDILRIAFEVNPERATTVLKAIKQKDAEINAISDKLVEVKNA